MSIMLERYIKNPILKPVKKHPWEAGFVYNCGAILLDNKTHIIYRAQGDPPGPSNLGYASSDDGFAIKKRIDKPIIEPNPDNLLECFGFEDPRITQIKDTLYMCYTVYGRMEGVKRWSKTYQIGISSISTADFLNNRWNWSKTIYPFPRVQSKDACIFPEKINGKYAMIHRIAPHIWISYSDDLTHWHGNEIIIQPLENWEYRKIGAGSPPILTEKGWLLFYHGVDRNLVYRLGFVILDRKDPQKIIYRHKLPIMEPEKKYEKKGLVPDVVFSCGAVVKNNTLFVYYGAADKVIGVATCKLNDILNS